MKYTNLSEDDMDVVKKFAFGGIANPMQRPSLRASDRDFLAARQAELDAFEAQRQAYNAGLTKYQEEVYNPYQQQAQAYNAAAQQYNTEVFEPYKQQFDAYEKAIADYNAGPRTADYAGPAAPTLAREFDMAAPTAPGSFDMTAPVLPFKEEEIVARQQQAAETARKDAGNRAVAIDVVSNPDKFNFGSMSIANRFMAEGGLVEAEDDTPINTDPLGSAQQYMAQLTQADRPSPTRQSVKRVAKSSGGAGAPKEMAMGLESLSTAKDLVPQLSDKGSSRQQMEELARVYQLKVNAAKNKARGLSADTFGAPTLEGPALTKNTLAKKRFAKGGEVKKPEGDAAPKVTGVNKVLDFIAQRLPADVFPTSGRTLLETVQGAKTPITEKNFSAEEMDVMRELAALKGGDKGSISYADYVALAKEMNKKGKVPASMSPSLFSMADPMGNVQTTLGQFRYMKDPQGNLQVVDKYDFNPPNPNAMQEARTGDYGAFGPYGLIRDYAGEKVPPGKGREVRVNLGPVKKRAEGSPEEGEVSQAEREAASKPAFVTPKSGIGRKRSSKAGELEAAALQGVSETPYNLLGAPVDLATMVMRPFGYDVQAPMLGSEDLKRRATKAGIRQEPPKEGTAARALYNLSEIGASAVNPAAPVRAGMKAAKAVGDKATDVAKDFQQYNRQLTVPGASYAVRPTGSTMLTGPVGLNKNVSEVDQLLNKGRSGARGVAGQNVDQEDLIAQFWDKKARNYFTRQFGTPDDPIAAAISKKQIKGSALEEVFPEYMLDQIAAGKTRVNEQGQSRFFPKYPRAMEDFTKRYDQATGIKGNLITSNPAAADQNYNLISTEGRAMGRAAAEAEGDKMIGQGLRPELINPNVGTVARSVKDTDRILSDGTESARSLLGAFEEASAYRKMTPEQQTEWANTQFGNGRRLHGMDEEEIGQNLLGENVRTAIEKGEPVYDIGYMGKPLSTVFKPDNINQYLASLPLRELANIRFEDAVRGGLKLGDNQLRLENIAERIKSGKPVADTVFSQGVSSPLLQFGEGSGLDGFAWKRIEKREATVPEGAYVGHSVGGYELGGATYTNDKRDGFNTGLWQVYTLRDNRNRPVNTIEVKMLDETTPVVTQIKGNGRATGNTAPEKYDGAVLRFLQDYLKPAAIEESDSYLTPLLQNYKTELGASPRVR